MSHGDEAENIPKGFEVIGHTENSRYAAVITNNERRLSMVFNFILKSFIQKKGLRF